jgi:hypothetical protein
VTTFSVIHISEVMLLSGSSALYIPRCLPEGDVDVFSLHDRIPFQYSCSVISVGMGSTCFISSGIANLARTKVDSSGQFDSSKVRIKQCAVNNLLSSFSQT